MLALDFLSETDPDDSAVATADVFINLFLILLVVTSQLSTQTALRDVPVSSAAAAQTDAQPTVIVLTSVSGDAAFADSTSGKPIPDIAPILATAPGGGVVVLVPKDLPANHLHDAIANLSDLYGGRIGFDFIKE